MASFQAGGTLVLSYTNGTDRWEARIPLAQFDPTTFAYTGAGLKAPLESDVGHTFAAFGGYWAAYFDSAWSLSIEAVFWTNAGTATRLATVPTTATVQGTSPTPASTAPPLQRAFRFDLDHGGRHVVRLFGVASDTMGPRNTVTATSGGFDARDQALVGYLAGPGTGLVAWDGQVFPPIATAYQRYKLRPFEGAGPAPAPGPATSLPPGPTGAILIEVSGGWVPLPPTVAEQQLVLGPTPSGLLPQWGTVCCPPVDKAVPGEPAGQPGASPHASRYRCGAALAMAKLLEDLYGNVVTIISLVEAGVLAAALAPLAEALAEMLATYDIAGAAFVSNAWVQRLARTLLVWYVESGTWPTLDQPTDLAIVKAVFCALPVPPAPLEVTDQTKQLWIDNLELVASTFNPGTAQLPTLEGLIHVIWPAAWQTVANRGLAEASPVCDGFTCPRGKSFGGGAQIGPQLVRSMQGGAQIGPVLVRSMQGGAQFAVTLAHSLQGGAQLM